MSDRLGIGNDAAPADAQVRARALDPSTSFIVQAPAGSGKTELLTQRYLRLLASVEHPEQVLAITFTRKAAAEMRNRILAALRAAGEPPPLPAHQRLTWELARAVREVDSQRQWRLLQHAARLQVQTIDAFNARLARQLPILAGTGASLEPTDDPRSLYEAAAERLIERIGDGSEEAGKLEALLAHLGNSVERLMSLLVDLLAKRDQWLHPVVQARRTTGLRAALEAALSQVIEQQLGKVGEQFSAADRRELWELACYAAGNLSRGPALNDAAADAALGRQARCLDAWQAVAGMLFKKDGELYQKVTKTQGFPPGVMKVRMEAVLADFAADPEHCALLAAVRTLPSPRYSDEQWEILESLLVILPAAVAELQLGFQLRGQADYAEGALRALRALGSPDEPTDLALAFDYRIRHLLIDEFQDTSFAQLDLLEQLTAGWVDGDGRTLFCVGDPMQSIYRFRQAEVGLFIELKQRGLGNVALQPLTLSANFRSTGPIVAWVNRVFPQVLAAVDDAQQGAVRYSPSFAVDQGQEGGVQVHPRLGADREAEAADVVNIVRETRKRDAQASIAVLVNAKNHVGRIAAALTQAGIEVHAVEIERLSERPMVQDLIALTRALVHLADRPAWLAVLRAPWCGLGLADLHALAAHDAHSTVNQLLHPALQPDARSGLSDEGLIRAQRAYAVLNAAIGDRGRYPLRDWVERTWNALGGPATLARAADLEDASAFFDRLDELHDAGDLLDVARLEEQLENLFARPQASGAARVEIMTIHKAKGLEFDTVILPGLQRWMHGEDAELMRWTRLPGLQQGVVFAPLRAQGALADPIYRWMGLLEKQRNARERGRLLYVAATRAKRHLHLLGAVEAKDAPGTAEIGNPHSGSMLDLLWHEVKPAFEVAARADRTSRARIASTPPQLRRLPLDWRAPPADPAVHTHAEASIAIDAEAPDFDWVTETGRRVGTLVHRELDRLTRAGHVDVTLLRSAATQQRLAAELAELGVPLDRCEQARERATAAIAQTMTDARGRWLLGLDTPLRDAESELALTGLVAGQLVNGVIDRTFLDEQGTRWIVDFKTSSHEGGGLDRFLDEEVERYRGQLTRYAQLLALFKPDEPIKAALYFPLLQAWREVATGM